MAYVTGTAANHLDLIAVLRDFLSTNADLVAADQNWSIIGGVASGPIAHGEFVSLSGPGLGGTDQILVTLEGYTNAPAGAFCAMMRGHTAYSPGAPSDEPPGLNTPWVYLALINDPVRYWIVANGRRFICVAKANNRYDVFYGGFVLPEHLPTDWTYPVLIGGAANAPMPVSQDGSGHRNFWNPSTGQGWLFTPAQIWRDMTHVRASDENALSNENILASPDWKASMSFSNKARAIDGSPFLSVGRIAETSTSDINPRNFLGSYDGLFYTPAAGAVIEEVIEYDGKDYLVIANVYRNSDNHVAAVCLE